MKLGISVVVFAMVVGCGGGFATVPTARWQAMPDATRTAVDASTADALASAHAEVQAAAAALAVARRNLATLEARQRAAAKASATAAPVASIEPGPDAAQVRAQQDRQTKARAEIDRATLAQLQATVTWRERRVAAATAQVDTLVARREFDRARAIDRSLPSDETYDVGLYRGQFASAQEQWYLAESRSTEASLAVSKGGRDVAAAKEAFANLVRVDKSALVAVARAPMQLSGFTLAVRRRGLKVVGQAPSPCRRGKCFRRASDETAYLVIARH